MQFMFLRVDISQGRMNSFAGVKAIDEYKDLPGDLLSSSKEIRNDRECMFKFRKYHETEGQGKKTGNRDVMTRTNQCGTNETHTYFSFALATFFRSSRFLLLFSFY